MYLLSGYYMLDIGLDAEETVLTKLGHLPALMELILVKGYIR